MNEIKLTLTIKIGRTAEAWCVEIPEICGSGRSHDPDDQAALGLALHYALAGSTPKLVCQVLSEFKPSPQIKLGQRYRSRDGGEWLCYRMVPNSSYPAVCIEVNSDEKRRYRLDGRCGRSRPDHPSDLIEEIKS